jgi:hypothetical protein
MVTSNTFEPILAAAAAASFPACPAPTTITSYTGNIFFCIFLGVMFHVERIILLLLSYKVTNKKWIVDGFSKKDL